MGLNYQNQNPPSQSEIQDEQNMQNQGLKIYQSLKTGQVTCQNLTSQDFEKLGEFYMGQAAGSIARHVYWDRGIEQMMGQQGNTNMHIAWGERRSGCIANAQIPSNTPSFFQGMMGYYPNGSQIQNSNPNQNGNNSNNYGGGGYNMMWGYGPGAGAYGAGFGILGFITWLAVLIDLILLGVYIWKRIRK